MHLRTGIPQIAELQALRQDELYSRHLEFNRQFLESHRAAMARYGRHWGLDPFKLWSRRWEYPFAAQRVLDFAAGRPSQPLHVLDAGSGVTYFPYFLCARLPQAQVTCCDYNSSYGPMFEQINRATDHARVKFVQAMLQSLPFPDASLDAVCCISVLEHTGNYEAILDEFARVLRPGGLLTLTFDLSLDGRFNLPRDKARQLLAAIGQRFAVGDLTGLERELGRLDQPAEVLTTDYVRRVEPQLLPWKFPMLKAAQDLVSGKGCTGGFRSLAIYCLEATANKA